MQKTDCLERKHRENICGICMMQREKQQDMSGRETVIIM